MPTTGLGHKSDARLSKQVLCDVRSIDRLSACAHGRNGRVSRQSQKRPAGPLPKFLNSGVFRIGHRGIHVTVTESP